jgi:hypothetical protein
MSSHDPAGSSDVEVLLPLRRNTIRGLLDERRSESRGISSRGGEQRARRPLMVLSEAKRTRPLFNAQDTVSGKTSFLVILATCRKC